MCDSCGEGFVNNQKAVIPSPKCGDDCPDDLGCVDIIPAQCVSVSTITGCLSDASNLQDWLQNIVTYICNLSPGEDVKVKIDSSDTTAGYLYDKVISDSLVITKNPSIGNKKLDIEIKPLEWFDLVLAAGWDNYPQNVAHPTQKAQYAIDPNGKIHFRGSIRKENFTLDNDSDQTSAGLSPFDLSDTTSAILPLKRRALSSCRFSFDDDSIKPLVPTLQISYDGSTKFVKNYVGDGGSTGTMVVILDGYSIETN